MSGASARERVLAALVDLAGDDLEVLALVAEGLQRGRAVYGEFNLAHDPRDMTSEALAEVRDALVYVAAALVRQARQGGAR